MPTPAELVSRTIKELCDTINNIDGDERYHYPSANVVINAPLALIQLNMEASVRLAQLTLESLGYNGPELAVRPGPLKQEAGR